MKHSKVVVKLHPQHTLYENEGLLYINSLSADDALVQLRSMDNSVVRIRVSIYADEEKMFLDTEGILEFCRMLHSDPEVAQHRNHVIAVVPCDYSASQVVAALGFAVELQISHPLFAHGITRKQQTQVVIQELVSKHDIYVVAGGIFSDTECEELWSWGIHSVFQYTEVGT